MKALENLRVIDLTRVLAGPYATMILADLGAEVIKVEAPEGDESRGFGPFKNGVSGYFQSVNRGKKSLGINLKAPEGRDILLGLLDQADILVENFRPGTMTRLDLDYTSLHTRFPSLIYAACSGFGQTGPYAGRGAYDMIIQGMGGIVSITGEPGRPPVRVGVSIGDLSAALFTVIGILTALHTRQMTGQGQLVDISMLDGQVALLENAVTRYDMTGQTPGPLGARHPSITPFQAFPTLDGWMMLAIGNNALWNKFCRVIERDDLVSDERFRDNESRTAHHEQLEAILSEIFRTRNLTEWLDLLNRSDIPCGPVQRVDEVMSHPQVNARGMILNLPHPVAGSIRMPGSPIKLSDTPPVIDRAAPDLGQHTDEVLERVLHLSPDQRDHLRKHGIIY
jgi:CoA:oxalate CoA-transferase